MKRAQAIGVNTVIIAAIALLVLILIAVIVTNSGGDVQEGLNNCAVRGGQCLTPLESGGRAPIEGLCETGRQCYSVT